MTFSYFEYFFLFLPVVIAVYFFLNSRGLTRAGKGWLIICSLLFYLYLSPIYLPLLAISIVVNFYFGRAVIPDTGVRLGLSRKGMLVIGILFNIALLGYFKYSDFFIQNINNISGANISMLKIVAPLGISYYTFLQLAFLVDAYRGTMKENDFISYSLFVSFFPKIMQGPIALQGEIVPQLIDRARLRFNPENFSRGLLLISFGLVKMLVIADNLAVWASQGYDHAAALPLLEAWLTMFAYCFQLYFDFSGYTDMAIGTGLMFNIRFPDNFDSPYKSMSYQELWRRWHITLGRFLREYIYIPLGGNRKNEIRTYLNLVITFLVGGLWHGAAWTYVLWGGMNGLGLIIHRFWRRTGLRMHWFLAWFLTFMYWNITVVPWRATSYKQAIKIYRGLIGLDGVVLPMSWARIPFLKATGAQFGPWLANLGEKQFYVFYFIILSAALSIFGKNSQEISEKLSPTLRWALLVSVLLGIGIIHMTQVVEFIYANF
jgi:alginate O-acetyltransferase complex protein AlgI